MFKTVIFLDNEAFNSFKSERNIEEIQNIKIYI